MTSFLIVESPVMMPARFYHTASMQPCHDSKDRDNRDCVEHANPQRAMLPNCNRSVHRKDSYPDFVPAAVLARRVSFLAATTTAMNTIKSTAPYITKTIGYPSVSSVLSTISQTVASVVRMREAMEAAFCRAVRVTLVGSITPAFTRSSYCSVVALKPKFAS